MRAGVAFRTASSEARHQLDGGNNSDTPGCAQETPPQRRNAGPARLGGLSLWPQAENADNRDPVRIGPGAVDRPASG